MKTTIFGMSLFSITFITLFIVICITGNTEVEASVSRNLSTVLTSALKNGAYNKTAQNNGIGIKTNDELIANIVSNIAEKTNSNSDITVNVKAADIEKGVVSVAVTQEYTKLNGKRSSITREKCVVLEQTNGLDNAFEVVYETDGYNYRSYQVQVGDAMPVPKNPIIPGKTFRYWTLNGTKIDPHKITSVDTEYRFVAVFS